MTDHVQPFRLDGTELAGYLVHSLIGRGGMAYVYRAEDPRLGRTVALKVLAPELAGNEDFRLRFLRESRLAASLDHPNIIPIYDAGDAGGMLYIAMRYVEGSDLKALLAGGVQLETPHLVDILSQVAAALDAAHAHGLVHRDVKPANILIAPAALPRGHDHVYLSDFGVTKRASSLSGVTAPGVIIGTMDYLAPEQIAGQPVSARTDVYALGCVVYQCLTGSVPFVRDDDAALLWAHLVEELPPISRHRPDLRPTVQNVLARATAKNVDDRYPSCGQFIDALTAELGVQGAGAAGRPADDRVAGSASTGARRDISAPSPAGRLGDRPDVYPSSGLHIPSVRAAPRRRYRKAALAVLAGVVAVALVLVGYRMLARGTTSNSRYTATDLVPVSFAYPADWHQAGGGNEVVFSRHADEIHPLFTERGGAQNWSRAGQIAKDDPTGASGLFTTFSVRDYAGEPIAEKQRIVQEQLPATVTFTRVWSSISMGRSTATRLDGELGDPAGSGTRFRFECYIALVHRPEPRTVNLIFFAPSDTYEATRATFDQIAKSVDLPG